MLVSLSDYAQKHGKSGDTIRRLAEKGALKTAHKIGRNWVVDDAENYPTKGRTAARPITVVSLFSGCGGMDLGFIGGFDFLGKRFDRNGLSVIWANDISPAACATYRHNLGEHVIEGDISEIMHDLPDYADVVTGGFPCQDISINGKMHGIKGKRSSLYAAIVETVDRIHPKVFVAENVGGLLLKQNEYSLKRILDDFNCSGSA